MATPTEHRTAAVAILNRIDTPGGLLPPTQADLMEAEIHANLAIATGTGAHYEDAEDLLARFKRVPANGNFLQAAVAHAILADRP